MAHETARGIEHHHTGCYNLFSNGGRTDFLSLLFYGWILGPLVERFKKPRKMRDRIEVFFVFSPESYR